MSDTIWVPAHIRRKPSKPAAYREKHQELGAAFMQDIRRDPKRLESELAKEIDREMEIQP